jgi:hypothetical protein
LELTKREQDRTLTVEMFNRELESLVRSETLDEFRVKMAD